MTKSFISTIIALAFCTIMSAAGISGTEPIANGNYYIYNVYQAKYLSYGNAFDTQVSLDNSMPLLCTVEKSGTGYKINTHYSLETKAYNPAVNNYLIYAEGLPFVNSRWGDSDTSYNDRAATTFTFDEAEEGYYITCTSGTLMFDSGTACVIGNKSEGFNADKSLWRFVSEEEYNEQAAKKTFNVAAMNVDGMPVSIKIAGIYTIELNSDGKEADGATAIGKKLIGMGYDVIGVSEDFNFNDEIMAEIGSKYSQGTHRGKIESSLAVIGDYISQSTLFDTDGLNLFWKTESTTASGETWTAWNDHYGYTDHEADGLINKGYRFYVITLSDGTQFDLYITHMEAGSDAGDIEARASQLTQLANTILESNNNRPIIIMGDTNCRYTRDAIKSLFIDVINADPRFTINDPWVEFGRQGIIPTGTNAITASEYGYREGEVVDKVFYINNTASSIRIQAEAYRQDLSFVNESGEPLADHWPCVVDFSYHDYDPLIDDVVDDVDKMVNVYLRNKETGHFLKQGGWWGTHAVQGVYGSSMTLTKLPSGKYLIQSPSGMLSQDVPYMDATSNSPWTLVKNGNYYSFTYASGSTTKALTANDPETFPSGPNTRYVTCAAYDANDKYQQWEILTKDELIEEMEDAIGDYNCTFLLNGANFDRVDPATTRAWSCNISKTASKMTYNFCDGKGNWKRGNYVAEVFNQSYSGTITYSTTWEISQEISGLPKGTYTVSCQGFYRDGEINQNDPGTIHSNLYARTTNNGSPVEVSTPLLSIYSAHCTEELSETKDANNYYIPNSMAEASQFFSNGYYKNNSVNIDITEGGLTIAVGKPDVTKSTSGWTCFDNFQIIYHSTAQLGDVNRDGKLNISDVSALINILRGKDSTKPYYYNHQAADVNSDGSINISDVASLIRIITNQ